MKIFNMRFSDTKQDRILMEIIDKHEGFSTGTKYVKQAVLEYYNRHSLNINENRNIEEVKTSSQKQLSVKDIDWESTTTMPDGTPIDEMQRELYKKLWGKPTVHDEQN